MGFQQFNQLLILRLLAEIQSQVSRVLLKGGIFGQISITLHSQIIAYLLQHGKMPCRSHAIENHAGDMHVSTKIDKALQQRSHRIGSRLGIDHQHNRKSEHTGYLGRRPMVTIIPVK